MIPARLGSKRIPQKNIRYMLDRPLVGHALGLAAAADIFDEIWVNSEAVLLKDIAEHYGAGFHHRPAHLADDQATNREFTLEFLQRHECDYVVIVNPTSPALRPQSIVDFCARLKNEGLDTLLTTVGERAETFYQGQPLNFSLDEKVNSQNLPVVSKVVWALSGWRRSTFLALAERGENPIFGGRMSTFDLPKDEACDLDTEDEWLLAEALLRSRQNQSPPRYYGPDEQSPLLSDQPS